MLSTVFLLSVIITWTALILSSTYSLDAELRVLMSLLILVVNFSSSALSAFCLFVISASKLSAIAVSAAFLARAKKAKAIKTILVYPAFWLAAVVIAFAVLKENMVQSSAEISEKKKVILARM